MQRWDDTRLRIDAAGRLANGSLRIDARPTRTGVLTYRLADGSTHRELRTPAEVFDPASLASLRAVPLTVSHPADPVTPGTWADVAVGHVCDDARPDGTHVASQIVVAHGPTIDSVESGELTELSCGYTCDLDPTPGVHPTEGPYDAIQRQIRYNHVAALPPGKGRAGPSAGFRFDSADVGISTDTEITRFLSEPIEESMVKVKVDGIEFDMGNPAHVAALEKKATEIVARADTAEGALATTKAELAKANDPARISKEINRRVKLTNDCLRLARGYNFTLDAAAVEATSADPMAKIKEILAKIAPEVDLSGASDDFVMGCLITKLSALGADESAEEPADAAAYDGSGVGLTGNPNIPQQAAGKMDARDARAAACRTAVGDANGRRYDSAADAIEATRNPALKPWEQPMASSRKVG